MIVGELSTSLITFGSMGGGKVVKEGYLIKSPPLGGKGVKVRMSSVSSVAIDRGVARNPYC